MSAGNLRDRVVFQKRNKIDDGFGNEVSEFANQFSRRVEIIPLKGTEKVMDSRLAGVQPFVIRVRYDKETACIENDWRAVDARDERVIYAIKTAEDMNRRREFIDIICETGTAA